MGFSMDNGSASPRSLTIGTVLLATILLYGVYGVAVNVLAEETVEVIVDDLYKEECGACHLAYLPGLLPAANWRAVMSGLDDHFGEDAWLEPETHDHILVYLQTHALALGQNSRATRFLRNLPDEPLLRITELPGFIQAHEEVQEQLGEEMLAEGFLSPCRDCHRQADRGIFDKELLNPGYGPQTWGGPPPGDSPVEND